MIFLQLKWAVLTPPTVSTFFVIWQQSWMLHYKRPCRPLGWHPYAYINIQYHGVIRSCLFIILYELTFVVWMEIKQTKEQQTNKQINRHYYCYIYSYFVSVCQQQAGFFRLSVCLLDCLVYSWVRPVGDRPILLQSNKVGCLI